jgi:hypothetical protein
MDDSTDRLTEKRWAHHWDHCLRLHFFMSDFEEKHIGKLREMGLNIWLRYVDDVYATVKSKGVEEKILLYLNSQHPNIRFTMDMENGDSMPFLCILGSPYSTPALDRP